MLLFNCEFIPTCSTNAAGATAIAKKDTMFYIPVAPIPIQDNKNLWQQLKLAIKRTIN